MAATAPLLHHSIVKIAGTSSLAFSDGWHYNFSRPHLLSQAQNVEQMAHLQQVGEREMRRITLNAWTASGDSLRQWGRLYEDGMGEKVYLAWIADASGLRYNIMKKRGVSLKSPQHNTDPEHGNFVEKAGGVEALVGAVFEDCGRNDEMTSEVMRRLGVYWPVSAAESQQLKKYLTKLRSMRIITG
ncbi:hypothetical protein PRZ48_005261 [Zasmidium cellare]|uniref:RNase III domain-containing protein n=1 Tax=Zasmidium cellare TaxID=395010 RepID=A0ABR0ETA5_ZASCE|nr:hypothetical protein PRZ48_005261 [Zasmidium cellare]